MELLRSVKIPTDVDCLWAPEFDGTFLESDDGVFFCHREKGAVVAVSDRGIRRILTGDSPGEEIPLPNGWRSICSASGEWLMIDESRGVSTRNMEFVRQVPEEVAAEYRSTRKPEKYYVEAPFHFDELTVSHHGQTGYVCHRGNEKLWTFRGGAYLYTDIIRYGAHIFFGTAGHGGYFYELNLMTGEPVAAIKTGDTARMVHAGQLCYVLQEDKGAKLLCVDLRNRSIVETLPLTGSAERYSAISMIGNQIHVITFIRKWDRNSHEKKLQYALWHVIRI